MRHIRILCISLKQEHKSRENCVSCMYGNSLKNYKKTVMPRCHRSKVQILLMEDETIAFRYEKQAKYNLRFQYKLLK